MSIKLPIDNGTVATGKTEEQAILHHSQIAYLWICLAKIIHAHFQNSSQTNPTNLVRAESPADFKVNWLIFDTMHEYQKMGFSYCGSPFQSYILQTTIYCWGRGVGISNIFIKLIIKIGCKRKMIKPIIKLWKKCMKKWKGEHTRPVFLHVLVNRKLLPEMWIKWCCYSICAELFFDHSCSQNSFNKNCA